MNEVLSQLHARKSVRAFLDRPIPTTALNDNPALGQNPGWKTK